MANIANRAQPQPSAPTPKQFLKEHSLAGKLDSIAKGKKKPQLVAAYNALFETEAFRDEAEEADGGCLALLCFAASFSRT